MENVKGTYKYIYKYTYKYTYNNELIGSIFNAPEVKLGAPTDYLR